MATTDENIFTLNICQPCVPRSSMAKSGRRKRGGAPDPEESCELVKYKVVENEIKEVKSETTVAGKDVTDDVVSVKLDSSLLDLPEDIISKIITNLDSTPLVAMRTVAKAFKTKIDGSPDLMLKCKIDFVENIINHMCSIAKDMSIWIYHLSTDGKPSTDPKDGYERNANSEDTNSEDTNSEEPNSKLKKLHVELEKLRQEGFDSKKRAIVLTFTFPFNSTNKLEELIKKIKAIKDKIIINTGIFQKAYDDIMTDLSFYRMFQDFQGNKINTTKLDHCEITDDPTPILLSKQLKTEFFGQKKVKNSGKDNLNHKYLTLEEVNSAREALMKKLKIANNNELQWYTKESKWFADACKYEHYYKILDMANVNADNFKNAFKAKFLELCDKTVGIPIAFGFDEINMFVYSFAYFAKKLNDLTKFHIPSKDGAKKKYKKSTERISINGKQRIVYLGVRGGKYVKIKNEYVSVSKLKK